MLIYAHVGLILTPTTPSPPPFSGYLFPELRHISPVLISRTNITFFHYTQGERERERKFPIRLRRILQTLDARSRNSAPRDHRVGSRPFLRWETTINAFYSGQSRRNMWKFPQRNPSSANCGTLFEKMFYIPIYIPCMENRILRL